MTHPDQPSVDPRYPALADAVAVMDRLRAPGGCPWDAAQTHESLVRYLIEECYELVQAIEDGDLDAMREELGDVLLQVLFHARIAAESPEGFDIEDVSAGLAAKLIRRHPHVFGVDGVTPSEPALTDADQQQRRWEELKAAESGADPLAGVALAAPSIALAGKLGARAATFDVAVTPPSGDSIAEQIFRLAYQAGAAGIDPETAVRAVAREHAAQMRAASARDA